MNLRVDAQLNDPDTARGSISNPSDDLIGANLNLPLVDELNQLIFWLPIEACLITLL
ncbi:MAG: hypothetical protein PHE96_01500 [Methylococcales bacterium]|nr:hypothetical protein [Methylococcales bacterium]